MTVKELIERLQTMPQDAEVYVSDWNEGYREDCPLEQAGGVHLHDGQVVLACDCGEATHGD
jgi:hypothetical protein